MHRLANKHRKETQTRTERERKLTPPAPSPPPASGGGPGTPVQRGQLGTDRGSEESRSSERRANQASDRWASVRGASPRGRRGRARGRVRAPGVRPPLSRGWEERDASSPRAWLLAFEARPSRPVSMRAPVAVLEARPPTEGALRVMRGGGSCSPGRDLGGGRLGRQVTEDLKSERGPGRIQHQPFLPSTWPAEPGVAPAPGASPGGGSQPSAGSRRRLRTT